MPYIEQARRKQLNPMFLDAFPENAGELNWLITDIVLAYIKQKDKVNYALLNEIMGVYESSKLEFYRRYVSKYEDQKIETNGDVYPKDFT